LWFFFWGGGGWGNYYSPSIMSHDQWCMVHVFTINLFEGKCPLNQSIRIWLWGVIADYCQISTFLS
jgi:hypothetical protein